MTTDPIAAPCIRCKQTRPVFQPDPKWGDVPGPLCSPCWQRYADARVEGTFADWPDAFDNADDDQLAAWLGGGA